MRSSGFLICFPDALPLGALVSAVEFGELLLVFLLELLVPLCAGLVVEFPQTLLFNLVCRQSLA